jgi:hypothetical protein
MLLDLTSTSDAGALDIAGWLQRLESQYAMAEQRRDHHEFGGGTSVEVPGDETTFFLRCIWHTLF